MDFFHFREYMRIFVMNRDKQQLQKDLLPGQNALQIHLASQRYLCMR